VDVSGLTRRLSDDHPSSLLRSHGWNEAPEHFKPAAGVPQRVHPRRQAWLLAQWHVWASRSRKQATNGVQALLDPQTNPPVAYALNPDDFKRSSGLSSASNRRHGDSNSSAGLSGASSPSQRGSTQRGSSTRSDSQNISKFSGRGNRSDSSKSASGRHASYARDNGYIRTGLPEDSELFAHANHGSRVTHRFPLSWPLLASPLGVPISSRRRL
jgi:hypothetical protein